MHPIEKKIATRAYASPGRARQAIGKSQLKKPEQKRLLALVDGWEMSREAASVVIGSEPAPVSGSAATSASIFVLVRQAHSFLSDWAEKHQLNLQQLLDDLQAFELTVRKEVLRREQNGSLEEPT